MADAGPAVPPHVEMIRMATAYWLSSLVYTAANIGLADHLADGAKSAVDLAGLTGMNPRALHRFMRTLASFGILTLNRDDTFSLTDLGATLKKDAPGSARSTVLTMAGPWAWQSFGSFSYSLETGLGYNWGWGDVHLGVLYQGIDKLNEGNSTLDGDGNSFEAIVVTGGMTVKF